jgi:leader peptidase (prepilin peptidase)/N-methyltransferase
VAAVRRRCGAAALGGLYLFIHLIAPAGMGGDVKLAVGLGALTGALGAPVWILAAVGAPVLTVIVATVAMLGRGNGVVPHGPSMCPASLLAAASAVPRDGITNCS